METIIQVILIGLSVNVVCITRKRNDYQSMDNIISLILFVEKTLDLNQEMLDALLETSDYIVSYSKAHNIPMLAQHEKRLKSLSKEIRLLSERMIIHISEFKKGVDK